MQLVFARLREFYREPEAVFWVYGFPILMAVALGIAFRHRPVEIMPVAVVAGPQAEQLADTLNQSNYSQRQVRFEAQVVTEVEARLRLRAAKVALAIFQGGENAPAEDSAVGKSPPGKSPAADLPAGDRPASDRPVHYRYLFDPGRPEGLVARAAVDDVLQRQAGRQDPVPVSNLKFEEPGGRYIDYLIPGLLGMSIMGGGLWGVGFVTVDMRIRKLLKRFLATPMKKSQFLGALMLSRMAFLIPEVLVLLVFARAALGFKIYGSWGAVAVLILLGAVAFAGLGLLVASRAKTIEAVSGLMNLVMLPMWVFSGIFFSWERFPEAFHPFIQALPLTVLNDALRAVMLDGASLASQTIPILTLLGWALASFALALRWFRWT